LGKVKTLLGSELPLRLLAGNFMVDTAKILQADIETPNGIIQVIDRVLIPLPEPGPALPSKK
jgi:uncharacterized surface protein with fasciclin (FAS1) repeats